MTNTYCPYIDHQIMLDFKGLASACCQFEDTSTYENYDSMMQPYREAMHKGEKIKPCRRCWDDEAKGFPSLRQSALADFKRYRQHKGTMILDLRITNNCNLACTMCSEHASSLWAKLKNTKTFYSLTEDQKNLLLKNCDDLIKVSVQGGEPFYGNEFIDFIERIPNKSNMQLEIFSNTITADIKIISKWVQEFKQVMFISSVDGIEDTFESIRWPTSWNKFEKKIIELYQIPKLGLSFNFTLQNLNIFNLRNFIDWRNRTVPNCNTTISILEWPEYYQFTNLTEIEIKLALKQLTRISNLKNDEAIMIDKVISQLQKTVPNLELLKSKEIELKKTMELRQKYLVRPERLELSTPSTSS